MSGIEQTFGNTLGVISGSFVQGWISPPLEGILVRASRLTSFDCEEE